MADIRWMDGMDGCMTGSASLDRTGQARDRITNLQSFNVSKRGLGDMCEGEWMAALYQFSSGHNSSSY